MNNKQSIYQIKSSWFFRVFLAVCVYVKWNRARENISTLYFIDFEFQCVLFSFSQQRELGFLVFGFSISVSIWLLAWCAVLRVCVGKRTEQNWWNVGNPHPPNCVWGCICIDYPSLFFPKYNKAKYLLSQNKDNNRLEFKFLHI